MSTNNLPEDKGGRCVGLSTLPSSYTDYLEILVASNSWSPNGLSRLVYGLLCPYIYTFVPTYDLYLSQYVAIYIRNLIIHPVVDPAYNIFIATNALCHKHSVVFVFRLLFYTRAGKSMHKK